MVRKMFWHLPVKLCCCQSLYNERAQNGLQSRDRNSIHPPFSFATEALSCPVFQSSALLKFQPCCSIRITVPLHLPPRLIFAALRPHCALRGAWLRFHAIEGSYSVLHDQQRSALSSLNPSSGRLNKTRLLPCFHCY